MQRSQEPNLGVNAERPRDVRFTARTCRTDILLDRNGAP
jgi:hypothetical protein